MFIPKIEFISQVFVYPEAMPEKVVFFQDHMHFSANVASSYLL